jgi:hypothetical protein
MLGNDFVNLVLLGGGSQGITERCAHKPPQDMVLQLLAGKGMRHGCVLLLA